MCYVFFRIVCKKRSSPEQTVWWAPGKSGYVSDIEESGRYTGHELENCGGNWADWYAVKYHQECAWRIKNPGVIVWDRSCPKVVEE